MEIINHLLSVHKFVAICIVPVQIVVIAMPFDPILEPSLVPAGIQYIVDFPFIFVIYHYWTRWLVLLTRQWVIGGGAKKVRMLRTRSGYGSEHASAVVPI